MRNKYSVITICYNDENLKKTCESIYNQKFQDFEWIVIDGGSNQETLNVFEKYKNRINYFVSEKDNGRFDAMNKGISKSSGDYLIFMNAGDCFVDNFTLLNANNEIEKYQSVADVFYGGTYYDYGFKIEKSYVPINLSIPELFNGNICHQSTFYKRELFYKHGFYDDEYKSISDWKYNLLLLKQNVAFKYMDAIISRYDTSGITSSNKELFGQERKEMLNDLFSQEQINKFKKEYIEIVKNKFKNNIQNARKNIISKK